MLGVEVVINERATRAPSFAGACDMRLFAGVGAGAVSIVVEENVFAVIGNVKIFEAIVVVIADAHALSPAGVSQAGFFGNIGERAVMVVAVEVARRCTALRQGFQRRAVYDENVGPAIIVVIENGDAGSRRFDDVFFRLFSTENDWRGEAGFLRHVGEMHDRPGVCFLGLSSANTRRACGLHGKPSAKPKEAEKPERRKMESHQTPMIARSGPRQLNLREDSPKPLVERRADVNMLVFLRTRCRHLSNGIDSRSSPDAFPSTACCGAVSLVRGRDDARTRETAPQHAVEGKASGDERESIPFERCLQRVLKNTSMFTSARLSTSGLGESSLRLSCLGPDLAIIGV